MSGETTHSAQEERAAIVAFIQQHFYETCQNHTADNRDAHDLVNHGYGNACINLRIAIESGAHLKSPTTDDGDGK